MDCTFTVLDASTGKAKHSAVLSSVECTAGGNVQCGAKDFIAKDRLDEFLHKDSLTLQVTASLTYFMDPLHITNMSSLVPSNDVLKTLLEDKLYADVTIKCGENNFQAHKAILASQSPVFNRMFESDMREKSSNVIEIEDIDSNVVSDMLTFLYAGTAPNVNTLAKGLLNAATKYELPHLAAMCENELMLNIYLLTLSLQCSSLLICIKPRI